MKTKKKLTFIKPNNKVQLSAKVSPQINFSLQRRADEMGMTKSALVEHLAALDIKKILADHESSTKKIKDQAEEIAKLKNIEDADLTRRKQEVSNQELATLNKQEELIEKQKKYIEFERERVILINEKAILKQKNKLIHEIALNDMFVSKDELQGAFKIPFDDEDVYVEGFHFRRYFLNPKKYILVK